MKKAHTLTENCMILVTQGSGRLLVRDTPFSFASGELLLAFAGEHISVLPNDDGCEYIYITFSGPRAEELLRRFSLHPFHRGLSASEGLIPLWQESLMHASPGNIDLAAESILLYTLSRQSADQSEQNDLIRKVVTFTEENFTDPTLSIATVSARLSYHPKYVSRVFKDKMGVKYTEYLRTFRMKYAISLFDHGISSVKNVALLSGFSDPFYFSTVFKSTIGITPTEYIKKHTIP